ncbi:ipsdienol dehydrogenase-like [Anthonomus grandis grandis]|uniref:ipsdienol dehydrogenase-like n=1 Tax=Anthonomus grandis grandis TaxID=2921223 RepID=UPI002166BF84|nr:ipsdienol dehydrogenase-like [Anthonomus grandis grandis]
MIKDSVFLITGGSSGIGNSISKFLLTEGAYLTILDLRPLADSCILNNKERVLFMLVDVTSAKDTSNALEMTERKFGKLNGVINCAQVKCANPVFNVVSNEVHSLQEFIKILDINLLGTFNVIRLSIPLLAKSSDGIIINTSSRFGHKSVAYSASKAGIIGITQPLSKELHQHEIRVVDIALGKSDENLNVQFGKFIKSIIETTTFNGISLKF